MDFKQIPISVVGPGSQPSEEDGGALSYIDMPGDMWTYRPPEMPEPDEVRDLDGARSAMQWLRAALADSGRQAGPGENGSRGANGAAGETGGSGSNGDARRAQQLADLGALDDDNRELVNQILGEGEVSLSYDGRFRARTQEAVLAGVWRTLYLDPDDRVLADILEVADVPHLAHLPDGRDRSIDTSGDGLPPDVVNALPILVELEAKTAEYAATGRPHEVNLTLLPLTDADLAFLDERLGRGPVDTLSRAYGKCQVVSTAVANVWWTRFFNSMGTPILTTLEVIDVPAILCAAPEDLRDSATRLDAILAPYWPDMT